MDNIPIQVIARMKSDFSTKFGIPRQSGLVEELHSTIIFEPEFRNPDALRGIEEFSHIWLIWQFSEAVRQGWSPTVRPPRLGGNTRMGVFATRSPFRPNNLWLSCVKLLGVEMTQDLGPVIHVSGADLISAGFEPGPEMGKILENLLEKVIEGEIPNEKEKLLSFVKSKAL